MPVGERRGCGTVRSSPGAAHRKRFSPHTMPLTVELILLMVSSIYDTSFLYTIFYGICAGKVGTGNIVGTSQAIALGGYGAIFWLWLAALLGMMVKYSEVLLAIKYRERDAKGDWVGGPMYYIKNGLGQKWAWLAILFCTFAVLASFGIGNMSQANSINDSIKGAIAAFAPRRVRSPGKFRRYYRYLPFRQVRYIQPEAA